ncbi:hypothetical protein BgAZ_201420 [Babesia gibsoni]|uniref:RRM domain-containing protein n=1 Tax=Babesia gibsoni TaxID=33632 RepID=A0AAD8PE58_BABGI|nr:hypothetical protein BgAZ_201420 [Babesia gibsoni]
MQLRRFTLINDCRWRLLLKGLPFDVTGEEIRGIFANRSSIQSVSLVGKSNASTGCAIVRFNSELEAVQALKNLGEVYIRKRKVEASLDFTDFSQRIEKIHKPTLVDRFRLPSRFY